MNDLGRIEANAYECDGPMGQTIRSLCAEVATLRGERDRWRETILDQGLEVSQRAATIAALRVEKETLQNALEGGTDRE